MPNLPIICRLLCCPPSALVAIALVSLTLAQPRLGWAVETITFKQGEQTATLSGRVQVRDQAGGVLLQTDDGALWLLAGDDVITSESDEKPFEPVTAGTMKRRLLDELPDGFRVYQTPHYLVAYNTSRDYAKWTSSMLERLHKAFTNYWSRRGFDLQEPEFPLVVMVYSNAASYLAASRDELGEGAASVVGYYSLQTNRIRMYDLTGADQIRSQNRRRTSLKEINQMLASPAAMPLVATVVHEATHQVTFNCGLQARYADLPLWLLEGMAVYFEAPDLSSKRGWQGIGNVNYPRLQLFRKNLAGWQAGSITSLLVDSKRFRNTRTAASAYADAWALNYYLITYRPDEYASYLQAMAKKKPLIENTPEERLNEFREHFGDLAELQADFLKQMTRID